MKLEVNIDKKYFFILLGAILILAGAIYGYAYTTDGSGVPSAMGHSADEIDGVQATTIKDCGGGKFIRSISSDGTTTCGNDNSGTEFGGSYIMGPARNGYPCMVGNVLAGDSCSCPSGYTSRHMGGIGIPADLSVKIYKCKPV